MPLDPALIAALLEKDEDPTIVRVVELMAKSNEAALKALNDSHARQTEALLRATESAVAVAEASADRMHSMVDDESLRGVSQVRRLERVGRDAEGKRGREVSADSAHPLEPDEALGSMSDAELFNLARMGLADAEMPDPEI